MAMANKHIEQTGRLGMLQTNVSEAGSSCATR